MLRKLLLSLGLLAFLCFAYFGSLVNYQKHIELKRELVNHPENLPKPELAKKTTFGFSNVIADMYWLQTIQYIGGNAISSDYKKYLFTILDLVTTLNPYFSHPYVIGMLLLPGYNEQYENLEKGEQELYTNQAVEIGLKGIESFCDMQKIELIRNEFSIEKIVTEEKYKNPCKDDMIPYSLAFVHYFYLNDPLTAAHYFKVAAAVEGSMNGARVMSAIMQGKGGDREKSIYMFLNMGRYIEDDPVCNGLSSRIEEIMNDLSNGKIGLSGDLIQVIEETRILAFGKYNEETKKNAMSEAGCQSYVNKATRELNLLYLELANKKYASDHEGKTLMNGEELLEAGYINYDPVDFQQGEDHGIVYVYKPETGNFDYENGLK